MDKHQLIELALDARQRAYCPYSGFSVGAALLAADGRVFCGCNIENAGFSPTLCAERTAMATAIAAGCRQFSLLVVCGGRAGQEVSDYFWPCGVCRQWLAEFCAPDFPVICAISSQEYQQVKLSELLPHSFSPLDLQKQ